MKLISKVAAQIKAEYEAGMRSAAMRDLEEIITYIEMNPNPDHRVISTKYANLQKKIK